MNFFRKSVLPALALIVIGLFSCNRGSVDLKLNFKPGEKYLYSTQVNQNINSFGAGLKQSMLMEMVYAAAGEEAGNKKLNITYDHILIDMMSPAGPVTYDSRSTQPRDPEMSIMDGLIGKSFNILVAPNGDIVKVEGLNDLIRSLPDADRESKMSLESQLSDTAVRLMMQNSFDLYAGKAVKPGDTWSKKSVMSFTGVNVNVENTYTLKSIQGDKATVAVLSVMKLPPTNMNMGQDPVDSSASSMRMEMEGKQEGSMEIETATGRIISGKTTQTINGKIYMGGQAVPMSITGDITISSKKL